MRVLLAEDDLEVRVVVRRALAALGHRVETVRDGGELLRSASERPPDVVLSDADMPVCGGIWAGLCLKKIRPGLPFILMTGDPAKAEEALRAGLTRVLRKPFALNELAAALSSF